LVDQLKELFSQWSGEPALQVHRMPVSGSPREYFRISGQAHVAMGTINTDREENEAFIGLSHHFRNAGLPVPEIYNHDLERDTYLQEDLGDVSLFDYLAEKRTGQPFPDELIPVYKKVLEILPEFQIRGARGLDFSICYPRGSFDRQSMQWDLSYFKYHFLKLAGVPFHEQRLEDDFQTLIGYLLDRETGYFLYRDFQSRNIMLRDGEPWFIDYQGGRKGALAYDVASLLFDSKADLPPGVREELLEFYTAELGKYPGVSVEDFRESYYPYVLIRIMQAMGAYGFRGFYEKKTHFLRSIPYALGHVGWILENVRLPIQVPELNTVLERLLSAPRLKRFRDKGNRTPTLTVSVNSFSYKNGIPGDPGGHGGGYVFDCRMITNPGKIEEYRDLTGKDMPVVEFLDRQEDVTEFISHALSLVDMSVDRYEDRKFNHLMVSFGCTGGQHRSVYCAEKLAAHLEENQNVRVALWHREID